MTTATIKEQHKTGASKRHQPVWEIAESFPFQGEWTEDDYFGLPQDGRRVELVDGCLEYLPVPTMSHEEVIIYFYELLRAFVRLRDLGRVFFAGIRMLTRGKKYRMPDIVFMARENAARMKNEAWEGADLVMEVVSPNDPDRDWIDKRKEYAQAGIPEYWIADPAKKQIVVLTLKGKTYAVHGVFKPGEKADSVLLKGFAVDVRRALCGEKR
jgi:Uma2 family endonuclease